ncbi:MAG: phospho-sugar mutase [Ruminococcaceae bacterium]|nr:phospho-sugar mutase [Oscillospiraceae bacterium]
MTNEKYLLWCEKATEDNDLIEELKAIKGDEEKISEAFYKDLEFGTGGLRGVIGTGTNRMNIYTVGKATQGIAEYVLSQNSSPSVAIAYDSRIKSDVFAKRAASILAANGVHVYIYSELMPTPMLSFAVRELKCDAGIVITASHNPAKYNGYKAYGPDGCQLCLEAAEYVLSIMDKVDIFDGVKNTDYDKAVSDGMIEYIDGGVIEAYLSKVEEQRVSKTLDVSDLKVIYTPLHGSGNKPVRVILKKIGIDTVTVVPEQEKPDGNFPTAPYPNPEIRQAFECALKLADEIKPDLLLATDPDCDRVGIAAPVNGDYRLFTGNEVGALLLYYILKIKKESSSLPEGAIAIKTIVTTELAQKIADDFGIELISVLTGFKFIGEQIAILEEKGEENKFLFGFEESYGYLAGSYVRDKDAVVASMLICEMAAYYKSIGKTLYEALIELYDKYGCYVCSQVSFTCEGQSGMQRISDIMKDLRYNERKDIYGMPVAKISDYEASLTSVIESGEKKNIDLPKSNVIGFELNDGSSIIVRPSGTEPKIKMYLSAVGVNEASAKLRLSELESAGTKLLGF